MGPETRARYTRIEPRAATSCEGPRGQTEEGRCRHSCPPAGPRPPDLLTLAGTLGWASEQFSWAGKLEAEGYRHSPHPHSAPLQGKLRELAEQASGLGAGMGPGGWGSWHQAVTLVESQYMKGAFPPHLQFPYPGPGFLPQGKYPFSDLPSSSPLTSTAVLTHPNLQATCTKLKSKLRSLSPDLPTSLSSLPPFPQESPNKAHVHGKRLWL